MSPQADDQRAADRLRDIESVTDSGLAHLGVEHLLVELLDRVRDVLAADTAAVLLLDEPNGQLVATAARGIEAEVYQGVRIPLGAGFAGRIAADLRPVVIEDIEDADVVNPVLRERGIRSLLGVPLLAGGHLLGVLHVGTVKRRRFDESDVDLLRLVADRVALATQTMLSEAERTASLVLQRSLLPRRLPQIPGLESAFRYVAGAGDGGTVGGDWYDLFVLPGGWVCATVGDVVGRGLRAATVMGRLRTSLRCHAMAASRDPGALLDLVDRQLRHFEPGEMATAVVGLVEPSFDRVHLSVAGHPAPVLATTGVPGRLVEAAVDPPLGVASPARRQTTTVDLPPGSVVCFYTDGLVERRDEPLGARLDKLAATVSAAPPEDVCIRVTGRLVGLDPSPDDMALLVLRREPSYLAPLELSRPAVASTLGEIRAAVRRWLAEIDASPADVTDLLLAVGESTSNVVEHAYGPGGGTVTVRLELQPPEVVVTVKDTGRWRPPRGTNRGRGSHIMAAVGDVIVERGPEGTEVVIRRRLGTVAGGS
jgi:anti-sigma regulatory factor (Ser/Thr protein kinase)/putative methionine-R-sulfoxide reductase with GAF domain